jgi:uncharacterized membrane protein
MPVKELSLDALRQRLPQLLQQVPGQLQKLKLPSRVPEWLPQRGVGSAALGWINWRLLAAAILLGGMVHICVTFIASLSATGQAYRQLADKLPANSMIVQPLQTPGRQILPFLPPDMLYAMCRYDLSSGSVSVRASVLDAGWALSVHTPDGRNLYVLPGQPRRRVDVAFMIVASGPDAHLPPRRDSAADTQIASPTIEGVVILRAPIRGLAWMAETEAALQTAACTPVKQ